MAEILDILTFDHVEVADINAIGIVYETLATLTTPVRVAGTYLYRMSMDYSYDHNTSAPAFQYTIDGGTTWNEMQEEVSNVLTKKFRTYSFAKVVPLDAALEIIVQAKSGNAAAVFDVHNMSLMVERKQ